jgi:hypothetical protein
VDPLTLACELGLLIWAIDVLRKHGWRTERPGLVWTLTAGALLTNVLFYVSLLPILGANSLGQGLGSASLYAFLIFRVLEWTLIVHVLGRLALVLTARFGLPGGFAYLRADPGLPRSLLLGLGVGTLVAASVSVLAHLWLAFGILERSIWVELAESGATWQAGFLGGLRNLFGEEVVTRLGVQTLLLYHLRRFRWASWVAVVASSLFFELWHSGGTDFYLLNFTASLFFAASYARGGYEAAAVGHCVADWLGIALPLLLLT